MCAQPAPVSGIGWLELGAGATGASEYPSLDCGTLHFCFLCLGLSRFLSAPEMTCLLSPLRHAHLHV